MRIEERVLEAKYDLYQKVGIKNTITKDMLKNSICKTGLVSSSRVIKSVIAYMRDHRHLGERNGKYYIIYRKKGEANPRSTYSKREIGVDMVYSLPRWIASGDQTSCELIVPTVSIDIKNLISRLKQKGTYVVKFQFRDW